LISTANSRPDSLRVAVVTENHAAILLGGAEYQSELLTDVLCRRANVAVSYMARRVPRGSRASALPYAVRCIGSDAGIRRRAVFFDAPGLWRALREFRPDVIYQQCKQSYTAVCARYARRFGIPFVFHVASDADLDHRWITLRVSPNTPFEMVESLSGDWGIRRASHIIVQTNQQRDALRANFSREPAGVFGIFQPLPASLPVKPDGPLQVIWIGQIKDVKRPQLFVDLAESLAGRSDLTFLMLGRSYALRRFAPLMRRIPEVPNLKYLGEQPIERTNELLSQAAIYVNTSSFEGFPNTFLQAWGRGAIVTSIAVDPDGMMESNGIGFRAGSFEGLRDLIEQLARSPEQRRTVAERAFAFAHEHHSMAGAAKLADLVLDAACRTRVAQAGQASNTL
jgi:glycosyltransferase involved in cell wall biosynthesis